jgi:hypothetical protein
MRHKQERRPSSQSERLQAEQRGQTKIPTSAAEPPLSAHSNPLRANDTMGLSHARDRQTHCAFVGLRMTHSIDECGR